MPVAVPTTRRTTAPPTVPRSSPGSRAPSVSRQKSTPTKKPSPEELQAARFAAQVVDAVAAGFGTHAPELSTIGLEIESYSPALVDLCDAAGRSLAIFSDLELRGESSTTSSTQWRRDASGVKVACEQVQEYCAKVIKGLEAVRPTLAKVTGIGDNANVDEALSAVGELSTLASIIADVRTVVGNRDLSAAKAVLMKHQRRSLSDRERSQASELISWLRGTWIPAMERWARITAEAEAARAMSDRSAIDSAVDAVREAATRESAMLAPVAMHGETVEGLVHDAVVSPAEKAKASMDRVDALCRELEEAIGSGQYAALAQLVREASADEELCARKPDLLAAAKATLLDLQRMAKITLALSNALKDLDTMALATGLKAANEVMLEVRCYGDEKRCREGIEASSRLVKAIRENPSSALPDDVTRVLVEHTTARGWAAELSMLYYKVGKQLQRALSKAVVGRSINGALARIRQGSAATEEDRATHVAAQALGLAADPVFGPHAQELALHIRRSFGVTIKVHFDSSARLVSVAERMDFTRVRSQLTEALGVDESDERGSLRLRYEDDGDFVLVATQSDWELLVGDALTRVDDARGLRVELYADRPSTASFATPPPPSKPAAAAKSSPVASPPPASQPPKFSFTRVNAAAPASQPKAKPPAVKTDSKAKGTVTLARVPPQHPMPAAWEAAGDDVELRTVASEATTAGHRSLDPFSGARRDVAKIEGQLRSAGSVSKQGAAATHTDAPPWAIADPDELELRTVASEQTSAPTEVAPEPPRPHTSGVKQGHTHARPAAPSLAKGPTFKGRQAEHASQASASAGDMKDFVLRGVSSST